MVSNKSNNNTSTRRTIQLSNDNNKKIILSILSTNDTEPFFGSSWYISVMGKFFCAFVDKTKSKQLSVPATHLHSDSCYFGYFDSGTRLVGDEQ